MSCKPIGKDWIKWFPSSPYIPWFYENEWVQNKITPFGRPCEIIQTHYTRVLVPALETIYNTWMDN